MTDQTKSEKVHEVFENIYETYDKMNSIISFKQHVIWRNATMKKMNVVRGQSALDLCCGTADWTIALAKRTGRDSKVFGLDFSEGMLSIGKEKVKKERLDDYVTLIHGNAMQLPFEDHTFDFVTIGFGLRNVPDYLTVLKEMNRVLKPGGMAVCLETSQPTFPIYKQLFSIYFSYIMPVIGKIFAKSYKEYSWLQESTKGFVSKKELVRLFEDAGLTNVSFQSHSWGAAATHYGFKK
ncbi:MAG: bifunctional demethylmenaquinone methyltransferase/2-methoxy-6-polyprenyl,4-benzoquinol methylase [Bacillales bacterium]|jgi:demethylmenaquinone methyltransferase/2-methoxy-6-polyprenyl-1,4-benzoquinol methylase|nr:bifunctional demethylmenaquinone methyltransferase/2-methoxy-6-polyprenyl,4-benzoquinol methylase [Bacillales bacterium]